MLTGNLIERLFRAGRWDALVEAISANGLELPVALRARLAAHPAAVTALALRRLLELTYAPSAGARQMLDTLLNYQEPDGSFNHDPLATACAAAALERVLAGPMTGAFIGGAADEAGAMEEGADEGDEGTVSIAGADAEAAQGALTTEQIAAAHQRALAALAGMQVQQVDDCGFRYHDDRTVEDRALIAAFISSLLAGDAEFRQAIHLADLANWFDRHRGHRGRRGLDPATRLLWSLARLEMTPPRGSRRHAPGLAA